MNRKKAFRCRYEKVLKFVKKPVDTILKTFLVHFIFHNLIVFHFVMRFTLIENVTVSLANYI